MIASVIRQLALRESDIDLLLSDRPRVGSQTRTARDRIVRISERRNGGRIILGVISRRRALFVRAAIIRGGRHAADLMRHRRDGAGVAALEARRRNGRRSADPRISVIGQSRRIAPIDRNGSRIDRPISRGDGVICDLVIRRVIAADARDRDIIRAAVRLDIHRGIRGGAGGAGIDDDISAGSRRRRDEDSDFIAASDAARRQDDAMSFLVIDHAAAERHRVLIARLVISFPSERDASLSDAPGDGLRGDRIVIMRFRDAVDRDAVRAARRSGEGVSRIREGGAVMHEARRDAERARRGEEQLHHVVLLDVRESEADAVRFLIIDNEIRAVQDERFRGTFFIKRRHSEDDRLRIDRKGGIEVLAIIVIARGDLSAHVIHADIHRSAARFARAVRRGGALRRGPCGIRVIGVIRADRHLAVLRLIIRIAVRNGDILHRLIVSDGRIRKGDARDVRFLDGARRFRRRKGAAVRDGLGGVVRHRAERIVIVLGARGARAFIEINVHRVRARILALDDHRGVRGAAIILSAPARREIAVAIARIVRDLHRRRGFRIESDGIRALESAESEANDIHVRIAIGGRIGRDRHVDRLRREHPSIGHLRRLFRRVVIIRESDDRRGVTVGRARIRRLRRTIIGCARAARRARVRVLHLIERNGVARADAVDRGDGSAALRISVIRHGSVRPSEGDYLRRDRPFSRGAIRFDAVIRAVRGISARDFRVIRARIRLIRIGEQGAVIAARDEGHRRHDGIAVFIGRDRGISLRRRRRRHLMLGVRIRHGIFAGAEAVELPGKDREILLRDAVREGTLGGRVAAGAPLIVSAREIRDDNGVRIRRILRHEEGLRAARHRIARGGGGARRIEADRVLRRIAIRYIVRRARRRGRDRDGIACVDARDLEHDALIDARTRIGEGAGRRGRAALIRAALLIEGSEAEIRIRRQEGIGPDELDLLLRDREGRLRGRRGGETAREGLSVLDAIVIEGKVARDLEGHVIRARILRRAALRFRAAIRRSGLRGASRVRPIIRREGQFVIDVRDGRRVIGVHVDFRRRGLAHAACGRARIQMLRRTVIYGAHIREIELIDLRRPDGERGRARHSVLIIRRGRGSVIRADVLRLRARARRAALRDVGSRAIRRGHRLVIIISHAEGGHIPRECLSVIRIAQAGIFRPRDRSRGALRRAGVGEVRARPSDAHGLRDDLVILAIRRQVIVGSLARAVAERDCAHGHRADGILQDIDETIRIRDRRRSAACRLAAARIKRAALRRIRGRRHEDASRRGREGVIQGQSLRAADAAVCELHAETLRMRGARIDVFISIITIAICRRERRGRAVTLRRVTAINVPAREGGRQSLPRDDEGRACRRLQLIEIRADGDGDGVRARMDGKIIISAVRRDGIPGRREFRVRARRGRRDGDAEGVAAEAAADRKGLALRAAVIRARPAALIREGSFDLRLGDIPMQGCDLAGCPFVIRRVHDGDRRRVIRGRRSLGHGLDAVAADGERHFHLGIRGLCHRRDGVALRAARVTHDRRGLIPSVRAVLRRGERGQRSARQRVIPAKDAQLVFLDM